MAKRAASAKTEGTVATTPRRRGRPRRPRKDEQTAEPAVQPRRLPDRSDELTELADGPTIRQQGRELFAEARVAGTPVSLAVIDADDFAEVNEVFGADRGDLFLKVLAERLAEHVEEQPLGRLSGDIFLLILPGIEPEEAFLKLETLRQELGGEPLTTGRGGSYRKHSVTCSIGIAGYPKDGPGFNTVLARAMAALRRAKRLGKNRVGLPPDDNMLTKTSHYPKTQLEALRSLAEMVGEGEAALLREALEDLLLKYKAQS